MFGKPEWFREKTIGWGLSPVSWHGWAYGLGWMAAIALPFAALISRHQAPEALMWLPIATGLLTWDVWGLRQSLRANHQEVLYISEDAVYSRQEPRRDLELTRR